MAVLLLCGSSLAQRLQEPKQTYAPEWPTCDTGKAFDTVAAKQAASSKSKPAAAVAVPVCSPHAITLIKTTFVQLKSGCSRSVSTRSDQ
jgi:hypothetical protein